MTSKARSSSSHGPSNTHGSPPRAPTPCLIGHDAGKWPSARATGLTHRRSRRTGQGLPGVTPL
eukprot:13807508-Alexandrium_andersonii.AAC.1